MPSIQVYDINEIDQSLHIESLEGLCSHRNTYVSENSESQGIKEFATWSLSQMAEELAKL